MNIKFEVSINCGSTFASYQYASDKSIEIMSRIRMLLSTMGVDFEYRVKLD